MFAFDPPPTMNTCSPSRLRGSASLVTLLASLAAPLAVAGPGRQFWETPPTPARAASTVAAPAAASAARATSSPIAAAMQSCTGCGDTTLVEKIVVKDEWKNGRGPKHTEVVGTQSVCECCLPPMAVMKPSWSNARGPLHAVRVPVTHVCQPGGTFAAR